MNNIFYTTVDKNRLHIADENSHFGGSINSYNNFLTRFFANLFRKSIVININEKKRTVNRKSYEVFLNKNGIVASKENLKEFVNFNTAMVKRTQDWTQNHYMRYHLTRSKSKKLFKKMIHALYNQKITEAQKLAGKGANIELVFWERGAFGLSFNELGSRLPKRSLEFHATRYNTILYAAKKGCAEFVQFLLKIGSGTDYVGETVKYKRRISHVENHYQLNYRYAPVYQRTPRYPGYYRSNYVLTPQIDRETIIHFNDKKEILYQHYLDNNCNYITQKV